MIDSALLPCLESGLANVSDSPVTPRSLLSCFLTPVCSLCGWIPVSQSLASLTASWNIQVLLVWGSLFTGGQTHSQGWHIPSHWCPRRAEQAVLGDSGSLQYGAQGRLWGLPEPAVKSLWKITGEEGDTELTCNLRGSLQLFRPQPLAHKMITQDTQLEDPWCHF